MEAYIMFILCTLLPFSLILYGYKKGTVKVALKPTIKGVSLEERKNEAERIINFYRVITFTGVAVIVAYVIINSGEVESIGVISDSIGIFLLYKCVISYLTSKVRLDVYKGITETGMKNKRELIDIETDYEESKSNAVPLIVLGVLLILLNIG